MELCHVTGSSSMNAVHVGGFVDPLLATSTR
jgi:hypothetical protein